MDVLQCLHTVSSRVIPVTALSLALSLQSVLAQTTSDPNATTTTTNSNTTTTVTTTTDPNATTTATTTTAAITTAFPATGGGAATQASTTYPEKQFGIKDDTVLYAFVGLCLVISVFVLVLSIVFVAKTCYCPKPIDDDLASQQPLGQREQARRKKKKKPQWQQEAAGTPGKDSKTDGSAHFEVSELGTISESNSEWSGEENREKDIADTKTDPSRVSIEMVRLEQVPEEESEDPADPRTNNTQVQMDIPFERVTCGRRIGKGGVGSVYAGELHGVGPVALKKMSVIGDQRLESLAQEAKMMAALRHKYIVFLYGLTIAPEEESINGNVDRSAYLVMELCSGDVGSLIDNSPKLKQAELEDLPVADAGGSGDVFFADRMALLQKIAQQVAETMEFVHAQNVVHRDLKPANILLTESNDIRIADFGLSKALNTDSHHQTMEIGTPAYMAPELIVGIQEDDDEEAVISAPKKLDVYAFGILLWSLFMDLHPYPNLGAFQTIYQVKMMNLRPKIPTTASIAIRRLLERCWTNEPTERPSFSEINGALASIITEGDWMSQDDNVKIFVD